jgi:hypothetical protein
MHKRFDWNRHFQQTLDLQRARAIEKSQLAAMPPAERALALLQKAMGVRRRLHIQAADGNPNTPAEFKKLLEAAHDALREANGLAPLPAPHPGLLDQIRSSKPDPRAFTDPGQRLGHSTPDQKAQGLTKQMLQEFMDDYARRPGPDFQQVMEENARRALASRTYPAPQRHWVPVLSNIIAMGVRHELNYGVPPTRAVLSDRLLMSVNWNDARDVAKDIQVEPHDRRAHPLPTRIAGMEIAVDPFLAPNEIRIGGKTYVLENIGEPTDPADPARTPGGAPSSPKAIAPEQPGGEIR